MPQQCHGILPSHQLSVLGILALQPHASMVSVQTTLICDQEFWHVAEGDTSTTMPMALVHLSAQGYMVRMLLASPGLSMLSVHLARG